MLARQLIPASLAVEPRKPPSHIKVAVGLSIGLHVALGAYVAFLKFRSPPVQADPPERVFVLPLVDPFKPPPPPEPTTQPPPKQTPPRIHEAVLQDAPPPIDPLPAEPAPRDAAPSSGPVTTLTPQPTAEPPTRPRDPIIRDPTWVRRPDAGDFARFYPDRAMRMGVEGHTQLTCSVTARGDLTACRVTGETPLNYGFGAAALKLSRFLQIGPKTVDGQHVDGGILVVPIDFRLK